MEQALADQFGYPDYATLCREMERTMGKGVLRQLEQKLAQYPVATAGEAEIDGSTDDDPGGKHGSDGLPEPPVSPVPATTVPQPFPWGDKIPRPINPGPRF